MENELRNKSYIFIPFLFEQNDFQAVAKRLDQSDAWAPVSDKIMYMYKYVSDKFDREKRDTCQCFHYRLKDAARLPGFADPDAWYSTGRAHRFRGKDVNFRFRFQNVHLYCFRTSVAILAFDIVFENSDPLWISNALFHLKKVSREGIVWNGQKTTLLLLAQKLTEELLPVSALEFFYYANPGLERANVLTYVEAEKKDSYKEELYYLSRCYSEGYTYSDDVNNDHCEIYVASSDIVWGISPEAAACITCPGAGHAEFIQKTFYNNFNAQYLFMYVLLLHQKYVLYMFLTKIGIGMQNDLERLEQYRSRLYEFQTDFDFACVTEVPQYQNLYERMTKAFSLKKMYDDVHSPLISLAEIRREAKEESDSIRDETVNRSLLILSILSLFSALIDGFDFIQSFFGWFIGGGWLKNVQFICIVGILFAAVTALVRIGRTETKKPRGKEKRAGK